MAITDAMQRDLAKLARAANRRLERAGESQRSALDYYLKDYHTRQGAHGTVFQQGKAKTEREYRARMKELERFMGTEDKPSISAKKQWEAVKQSNLESGIEKLQGKYDLPEEVLAQVIKETGGKKKAGKAFYTALNNVMAAARRKKAAADEDSFTGLNADEVTQAINSRNTEYQATLELLKA